MKEVKTYSEVEIQNGRHFDHTFENEDGTIGRWFNDVRASLLVMPELGVFKYRLHKKSVDTGDLTVYSRKTNDDDGNTYNTFMDNCLI